MQIDRAEALRYMGACGAPDAQTTALLDSVEAELLPALTPKCLFLETDFQRTGETQLEISGLRFQSRDLCRCLQDAERLLLFAATLGPGADRLQRRYAAAGETAKAAAAQALGAAAIESYCDAVCAEYAAKLQGEGLFLTPRFSPGYGDLPLEAQRAFFQLFDISKRIGLTLTDACMMLPTKSVTAFLGVRRAPACEKSGCASCQKTECAYRKGEG